jgi:hypothetical protein
LIGEAASSETKNSDSPEQEAPVEAFETECGGKEADDVQ